MTITEAVQKAIEDAYASGNSQTEIARRLGVSQDFISRWRSGQRAVENMRLDTFQKMFPHAKVELNAGGNTFSGNISGNGVIQNNVSVSGDNHVHNCPQTPQESELLERFRKLALSKQAKIICLLDELEWR